jgi:hypothetical protein
MKSEFLFWIKDLYLKCQESAIPGVYPKCVSVSAQVLIQVDKWGYLKNPSQEFKKSFFLGTYESLKRLERANFLRVQSGRITVCHILPSLFIMVLCFARQLCP